MVSGAAAARYAQAVFQIAVEQDSFDEWNRDLERISAVTSNPEMAAFLRNANISRSEKERVALETIIGVSSLAQNLVRLLVERNRLQESARIFQLFEEMMFERRGIARATITTAVPLTSSDEPPIVEKLGEITGKNVRLTAEVAPEIIGGLVARIGDKLFDGSTRSKLESLRRRLAGQWVA